MSGNSVKTLIGVAAAIAIPFAAPLVAGAIGLSGALSTALVGSGLGAAAGYATNGTKGAIIGAIGGGIAGYMNPAVAATPNAGLPVGGTGWETSVTPTGGATTALNTTAAQATAINGSPTNATPVVRTSGVPTGNTGLLGGAIQTAGSTIANGLLQNINAGAAANLAMQLYNKPVTDLTDAEKAQLKQLDDIKGRSEEMYNQAIRDYMAAKNQLLPNPEKVFADTQQRVNTLFGARIKEQTLRGVNQPQISAEKRRRDIEGARLGALNTEVDAKAARDGLTTIAGLRPDPSKLPLGSSPVQAAIEYRNEQNLRNYNSQVAQAAGGLFGVRPATATIQSAAPRQAGISQTAGYGGSLKDSNSVGYTPVSDTNMNSIFDSSNYV